MTIPFQKSKPQVSLDVFLSKVNKVVLFTSSNGRRYQVLSFEKDVMFFLRLDAKSKDVWQMNLKEVYRAYQELDDFATVNFKPYVPITHSPARGLLLHLGILRPIK